MAWMIPIALWAADKIYDNWNSDDEDDIRQVSRLTPEQRKIEKQRLRALKGPGGGGAYGQIADYYRSLMDPNSQEAGAMMAPEQRKFNEQIIPDLGEQFAGMGAGGLTSSGFRNAGISASTDLAERLASIRANLSGQGAAGLANLGNNALQPTVENVRNAPQATLGENAAQGFGEIAPQLAMDYYRNSQNQQNIQQPQAQLKSQGLRNSSPYGNKGQQRGLTPNTSGPYNGPTFLGY